MDDDGTWYVSRFDVVVSKVLLEPLHPLWYPLNGGVWLAGLLYTKSR